MDVYNIKPYHTRQQTNYHPSYISALTEQPKE